MGFTDVIDRWRVAGDIAKANKAKEACRLFRREHPDVYRNFDVDPNLDDHDREQLLDYVLLSNFARPDGIKLSVEGFSRGRKLTGPIDAVAQSATLGHVMRRREIDIALTNARRAMPTVSKLAIGRLLSKTKQAQLKILRDCYLAEVLMWSFYRPTAKQNPFKRMSTRRRVLRSRLGLAHIPEWEELVWFGLRLQDQKPHVPTVLDAEMHRHFCPGGFTKPLKGKRGVPEVVHETVRGSELATKIREAKN